MLPGLVVPFEVSEDAVLNPLIGWLDLWCRGEATNSPGILQRIKDLPDANRRSV